MAKVIKNGEPVECEVLHENAGQYIVKFKTGVVREINKNRVYDLDRIDEGVLDTIRNTANKYGKKVISAAKNVAEKVKGLAYRMMKIGKLVVFADDEKVLPAMSPVNTLVFGQRKGVTFVPGDDVVALANENGIPAKAFEDAPFDDAPFDGDQYITYPELNESYSRKPSNSILSALFEAEEKIQTASGEWLKPDQRIDLGAINKAPGTSYDKEVEIYDWTLQQISDRVFEDYESRYDGFEDEEPPVMMFGAPGIGKTAIIASLRDRISAAHPENPKVTVYSIDAASISFDTFTMPAVTGGVNIVSKDIEQKYFDGPVKGNNAVNNSINKAGTAYVDPSIKDLPKTWLPVYDTTGKSEEEIYYANIVANGGKVDEIVNEDGTKEFKVVREGYGGIFFIDEFSRITFEGHRVFMGAPHDRKIAENLKFGDRWVFICAANRKSDMSKDKGQDAYMDIEPAIRTRWSLVNYVPEPDDWFKWGMETPKSKRFFNTNICPEIIEYVKYSMGKSAHKGETRENTNPVGDYYEVWNMRIGDQDAPLIANKSFACPRTWAGVSDALGKMKYFKEKENNVSLTVKELVSKYQKQVVDRLVPIIGGGVVTRFVKYMTSFVFLTADDVQRVLTQSPDSTINLSNDDNAKRSLALCTRLIQLQNDKNIPTNVQFIDDGYADANELKQPTSTLYNGVMKAIEGAESMRNFDKKDDFEKARMLISVYYFLALISLRLESNGQLNKEVFNNLANGVESQFKFDPSDKNISKELSLAAKMKADILTKF
jgi:hypothetical protein